MSARGGPVGITLDPGWRACVDPAWLDRWSPETFDLGDGSTQVVVMGAGPPLVLVPPLPGLKEAWLAVAAPLARSFRVVTFDVRVVFPGGQPAWPVLLGDMERILDALAPGPAVVVGHSLGGALAQQWTLAHPERVRALVLSSSFTRVTNPPGNLLARFVEQPLVIASQRLLPPVSARAFARLLARHWRWVYDPRCDDRLLDLIRHCMRHTSAASVRAMVALAVQHDTRTRLPGIRVPTLVLVGEKESPFTRPAADELARTIPGAELRVSPAASHLHPLSSPEWFVDNLTAWLKERSPA